MPGTILALDVGRKRIGLAVSDPLGIAAHGLPTLHRTRIRDDIAHLKKLAEERSVELLLVGEPLHMSGEEGAQSEFTREFAQRAGRVLKLPVVFRDERLTSMEAEWRLREAGLSTDRQSGNVDRMAATILLEGYLAEEQS